MNKYDKITAGFTIFNKYEHGKWFMAEHDAIYAGPDPDDVSDEDKVELEKLGWHPNDTRNFMMHC